MPSCFYQQQFFLKCFEGCTGETRVERKTYQIHDEDDRTAVEYQMLFGTGSKYWNKTFTAALSCNYYIFDDDVLINFNLTKKKIQVTSLIHFVNKHF